MITTGQKITEFITRAETYVARSYMTVIQNKENGDEYIDLLYRIEDLFRFLIELQSLGNQWSDKTIEQHLDYWDNEANLKTMMGVIPDPYRHYENNAAIIRSTNTLIVPEGEGLLYQNVQGNLELREDADTIISNYNLQ